MDTLGGKLKINSLYIINIAYNIALLILLALYYLQPTKPGLEPHLYLDVNKVYIRHNNIIDEGLCGVPH